MLLELLFRASPTCRMTAVRLKIFPTFLTLSAGERGVVDCVQTVNKLIASNLGVSPLPIYVCTVYLLLKQRNFATHYENPEIARASRKEYASREPIEQKLAANVYPLHHDISHSSLYISCKRAIKSKEREEHLKPYSLLRKHGVRGTTKRNILCVD